MRFWRPLRRGAYKVWTLSLSPQFEARGLASKIIRRHFNVFVVSYSAENDKDHLRW